MIETCADSYITDIFFSCKCVIDESTRRRRILSSDGVRQYLSHFYSLLSMSAVFLIAVDTLSNTAIPEKTNKPIDDPDGDMTYSSIREYFSLGNAINKPHPVGRVLWEESLVLSRFHS